MNASKSPKTPAKTNEAAPKKIRIAITIEDADNEERQAKDFPKNDSGLIQAADWISNLLVKTYATAECPPR